MSRDNASKQISARSLWDTNYYIKCLSHRHISIGLYNSGDFDSECNAILNAINSHFKDEESRTNTINEIKVSCRYFTLDPSELNWISRKDTRLCYWLLSYLKTSVIDTNFSSTGKYSVIPSSTLYMHGVSLTDKENIYDTLLLPRHTFDLAGIHQIILAYFERWNADVTVKRSFLKQLMTLWEGIYQKQSEYDWLDYRDKYQAEWAWNYIQNYKNKLILHWFLSPVSAQEKYWSTIAALDMCLISDDAKELLFIKMKKAWGQKKHRDKQQDRKAYNIVMRLDIKDKLNALAEGNNKKINETLEWLIDREFEERIYSEEQLDNS